MTVVVTTDLTTDEARRRPDGEMVLSVTTTQATPEYARNLTDRIKVGLDFTWVMVKEAYQVRAHAALGYASWDDYCTREFGTSHIRIPREDRPEAVNSLRDAGLSIRAIASAAGVSTQTVQSDLRAGVSNHHTSTGTPESGEAPEPKPITGTDGKTYVSKARTEPPPELTPSPAVTAYLAEHDQKAEDISYVTHFLKALTPAVRVPTWDAERLGQLLDDNEFAALERHAKSLPIWVERVATSRRGLRLVPKGTE